MRFYSNQHQYYAGIDLHARKMYICVLDSSGKNVFHKNMNADPTHLQSALTPFLPDVVVGVECVFTWYWMADYCQKNDIPFTLGHALYMKAIHGGKTKNDKIDSFKIASMLRGGLFPMAYVYSYKMRAARDLLRRRHFFVHQQSELLAHIQNTNTQYNYEPFPRSIKNQANRADLADRYTDPYVKKNVQVDLALLDAYHHILLDIELQIKKHAVHHDSLAFNILKTIPGVGPILSLTILYEICDIKRFESVGNFISYSRLVKCAHESAGKRSKGGHNKIGSAHLKWAFSEAAVLFLRNNDTGYRMYQKMTSRYGKAKALSLLAQKLGRTVYYMLKRKEPFSAQKFYGDSIRELRV